MGGGGASPEVPRIQRLPREKTEVGQVEQRVRIRTLTGPLFSLRRISVGVTWGVEQQM